MLFNLDKKVAIVTGSAAPRGIGIAITKALVTQGATVVATDRDIEALKKTVASLNLGDKVICESLDVVDEQGIAALCEKVFAQFKHIDILVNCAGISQKKRGEELTANEWDLVQSINLKGTFLCSKAVVQYMRKNNFGRIVNISSLAAKRGGGWFGGVHYSASKAGVLGFSKAFAREVAADSITINCVTPGLIATDIRGGVESEERQKELSKDIPIARMGTPDEIAAAVCFLASNEAGYITGEDIDVNGGSYMD